LNLTIEWSQPSTTTSCLRGQGVSDVAARARRAAHLMQGRVPGGEGLVLVKGTGAANCAAELPGAGVVQAGGGFLSKASTITKAALVTQGADHDRVVDLSWEDNFEGP
jgi:hypothetical protein